MIRNVSERTSSTWIVVGPRQASYAHERLHLTRWKCVAPFTASKIMKFTLCSGSNDYWKYSCLECSLLFIKYELMWSFSTKTDFPTWTDWLFSSALQILDAICWIKFLKQCMTHKCNWNYIFILREKYEILGKTC